METFGVLLRRHRTAAVLTQERLAERARISATGIAALEAGRRKAPRASTVALLLDALELTDSDRAELVAAAAASTEVAHGIDTALQRPSHDLAVETASAGNFPGVRRRFNFVGRSVELDALADAWRQRRRVVLVTGEAGVGKTRLVGEFILSLAAMPTVLWGRCTPDRLGAYEPFVEPIRSLLVETGRDVSHGTELARLVPEVAIEQGWATGPSRAEPEVERRLLFEAVVRLLAALGPTLLVIDDVQWADSASLALLTHLVASPALEHLVVVGTVRSTDQSAANAGALADLRRLTTVERLELHGLPGSDLARLVGDVAGGTASPTLVATIAAATEGNPLFVEELTEHLLALDSDLPTPPPSVPLSVRETLGRRIGTLSAQAQSLIRSGSVLGRSFDADAAGSLVDLDGEPLLAACDDALLSGMITEASATQLSFSHALVQSAVYETMSARRRLELHRRAARSLEDAYESATTSDAVVFDIARHWSIVAAADPAAASAAARWAMRAGDAAASAADIDEAIVRYEQADRLWGIGTRDHASTLIRLGTALTALGRAAEADQRFRSALLVAEGLGDASLFAQAAIGLAATVRYGHSESERIDGLERAIALLGPDDAVLRPTAAAMLKRQLGFDPSDAAWIRRQEAARIVIDAVSAADPPVELLLSLSAARDSIVVDDPILLGRLSHRIVEVGTSPRNLPVLANAWYAQAWSTLELADGPGWDGAVAAYTGIAEELRLPYERALAATMATTSALIEGRYADAELYSQEALTFGTEAGDPNADAVHLTGAVMRGLDLGHASAMVELMDAMRDELAAVPTFWGGFAMTASEAGATDLARELFGVHARAGFDRVRRDLEWLPVIGFFCHACAGLDDIEFAPLLYDLLAASPARAVRVGPLAGWWGPTDYHLGALCRVMGRLDEAEVRLGSALETTKRLGARPWQARVQVELARVVEAARTSNAAEVDALRVSAASIAGDLGAVGIASRIS